MIGIGRLAAALILGIGLPAARAEAQNSSLTDMNMDMGCMLMAGMHEMQVSVYQSGATENSCQDIPSPGPAVITLSPASKELRDMTVEVRIVKDSGAETAASGNPIRSRSPICRRRIIRVESSYFRPISISRANTRSSRQ
jgi:hypothetical protein